MTEARPEILYDVIAIGNAVVDVMAPADEATITRLGLAKGGMTLIDAERRAYLQGQVKDKHSRSTGGGSVPVTNTWAPRLAASWCRAIRRSTRLRT